MIRFEPDTWSDAILRPFAMAAPDANVYVEIPAPDVRFAVLTLLAIATLFAWRRLSIRRRPVMALLALTALSMWPWLSTSGNGRYYIPLLLAVGPLCLGLICLLPMTRPFKIFLAMTILGAQLFVLAQSTPWGSWSLLAWKEAPYFQVDIPAKTSVSPMTYVTISSISYSLIAPQFPATSRWINLSSGSSTPRDETWTRQFLGAAGSIALLAPSIRQQMTDDQQPTQDVRNALNVLLSGHRLSLEEGKKCKFLPSKGLLGIATRNGRHDDAINSGEFGFWLCSLRYPVDRPVTQKSAEFLKAEAVFERVEQLCPRFFPRGNGETRLISGGALRHYSESDTKLYVLNDGSVVYKFWRALNPVLIGTVDEVMSSKAIVDCNKIRGRSGLPWEREI